jgi:hypothetical protein
MGISISKTSSWESLKQRKTKREWTMEDYKKASFQFI